MMPGDPPDGSETLEVAKGLARLRRFTPARIGLGRAGSGQLTATGLQFMLDHARARDAVYAALDFDAIGQSLRERGWEVVHVRSAAGDRTEYLRRPDLGRRLSPAGRAAIEDQSHGSDIVIVAADGLSAIAIGFNLLPVLDCLRPLLVRSASDRRARRPRRAGASRDRRRDRRTAGRQAGGGSDWANARGFRPPTRSAPMSPGDRGSARWIRAGTAYPISERPGFRPRKRPARSTI